MKKKIIQYLAVGCTAFGLFGWVGAYDLGTSPRNAMLLLLIGIVLILVGFKKGVWSEKDVISICDSSCNDASYPSYLGRSKGA